MAGVGDPSAVEFGATILTSNFQIRGKLHVLGFLGTFINDEQKPTLTVYGADVIGFCVTNPVGRMTQPEVYVSKRDAAIIGLDALPPKEHLTLMVHVEPLMAFTDSFAIAAKFHMGPDAHLTDFAEVSLQQYLVASDVKIYPLVQARPGLVQAVPLALIHKSRMRMYYKA